MKRFTGIFIAACAVLIGAAYAVPATPASAVSSAALSIVPKKNYTIEPGKSIKDKLTIRNLDAKEPLVLALRVVDFTFTDDGGTPKLMLDQDAPQTTWSLKPFMKIPETVTIAPNSSKSLDMSVAIPAKHGAGSYYSAIVYSSGASEGGNVGLSASGVTLVFTSIPGKVNEDLHLEKFGAYNIATNGKKSGYTFITTSAPETMAYTLKNNGNVTESPVGTIKIKGMFGKETVIDDVNPNGSLALIGQTRTYTACIKLKTDDVKFNGETTRTKSCATPNLIPGRYTATLDVFYGQNGNQTQEIVKTATFWYLPWWFIVLSLVVIAAIAYAIRRMVTAMQTKFQGPKLKRSPRRRK